MQQKAMTSDADLSSMFALAPVSLWLEDYSALRSLLEQWRSEGVTDLRSHLAQHPECIRQGTESLRVLQVNQRTLQLFDAGTQAQLLASLDKIFGMTCTTRWRVNGSLCGMANWNFSTRP